MVQMKMRSYLSKFDKALFFENFNNLTGLETWEITHASADLFRSNGTSMGAVNDVVSGSGSGSPAS
jgi:hypothetical protein